jgi:hypothetical protein
MKKKYEYKTVHVTPGATAWEGDFNSLGEEGYRLVAVVPLVAIYYGGEGSSTEVSNGSLLIFERRKETE